MNKKIKKFKNSKIKILTHFVNNTAGCFPSFVSFFLTMNIAYFGFLFFFLES